MIIRPRRLRQTPEIRRLVRETKLDVDDFIYPIFLVDGEDQKQPVESMPGSIDFLWIACLKNSIV